MKTPWHVPSLRGVMGDWVFYPALISAAQIATRIMSSHDIREAKALEDYLQRDLKPRVKKIVAYLKTRDNRFFNAILFGVFDALPNWVEFNLSAVANKLSIPNVAEIENSIGLLMFHGNEKMFAIDGQHRAEAIRQGHADFPERLRKDEFPVIFLAHVDDKAGKVRTRRLFCDINKNAVPVSEGDKVVIDEDDVCAIVTRRIYAEYPSFKRGNEIAVTEKKEHLAEDGRERFTSLLAVYTVSKRLKKLFRKPRGTVESAPENVLAFQKVVSAFFDFVIENEPSLNRYFRRRMTTPITERKENRNLVFRPIGLELLARLYAYFSVRQRLAVLEWGLRNLQWKNPGGVLDGIVWHDGFVESKSKAKTAAVDYCLYLLHELPDSDTGQLLKMLSEVAKRPPEKLPPRAAIPKTLLDTR